METYKVLHFKYVFDNQQNTFHVHAGFANQPLPWIKAQKYYSDCFNKTTVPMATGLNLCYTILITVNYELAFGESWEQNY